MITPNGADNNVHDVMGDSLSWSSYKYSYKAWLTNRPGALTIYWMGGIGHLIDLYDCECAKLVLTCPGLLHVSV